MVGTVHGVAVEAADVEALREGLLTMPAHPDVEEGLRELKRAGFRLVTLTNSPPNPSGKSPLEHAGLAGHFERNSASKRPGRSSRRRSCIAWWPRNWSAPSACCMVASHVWDTIGAQSVGFSAGLITRPGNAPLPVSGLPQPNVVAPDLPTLAVRLIELWRS